jgi:hypothetical protein
LAMSSREVATSSTNKLSRVVRRMWLLRGLELSSTTESRNLPKSICVGVRRGASDEVGRSPQIAAGSRGRWNVNWRGEPICQRRSLDRELPLFQPVGINCAELLFAPRRLWLPISNRTHLGSKSRLNLLQLTGSFPRRPFVGGDHAC